MSNPFRAVKARKLAEQAKAAANAQQAAKTEKRLESLPEAQQEFELFLNSIRGDAKRISELDRGPERVELKKELLAEYLPVIEKYLDGEAYRNEAFVWIIIWLWDTEDINKALEYTRIAIEQGQETPKRFNSTVAGFAARKMRDFAKLEKFKSNADIAFYAAFVEEAGNWVIPEQLVAELYTALGNIYFVKKDYEKADAALDNSFALGGKVKTIRDKCKKELAPKVEKPKAEKAKAKKPAAKKSKTKKPKAKKAVAKKTPAKKPEAKK